MRKIIFCIMVSLFGFCMNTTIGEAKWNPETYEIEEDFLTYGIQENSFTDATMVYCSKTDYDPYKDERTIYPCTQGIDENGNIVPITAACLMPYDNVMYAASEKYSFYKRNKEGRVIGTNDPKEAYKICELIPPEDCVTWFKSYKDNEGYKRILNLQPTVTVNITLRIDWDQTNKLLDLINADRAEVGAAPLVLDKNVTELAILRSAEHNVLAGHKTPDGKSTFSDKWDDLQTGSKLSISGENAEAHKTYALGKDYEFCKNEDGFYEITDEMVKTTHRGYRNSKGHYETYIDSDHIAIGICMNTNCYGDDFVPELFATGSAEDIEPLIKSGIEYRTIQVTMIDTAFDYYLQNPISEIEPGENHKLANYAAPVDYWSMNTFSHDTLSILDVSQEGVAPFDFSSLTFSSSDESVATVDKKGFVTGIKEGTATITTSLQGKHVKEIPITVKKKEELIPTPTPTPPKASDKPVYYNPIVNPAPDENIKKTVKNPVKVDYTAAQWKTIIETPQIKKAKNVKKRKISLSWSKVTYEGYTLSKKFKVEYALNKSFTKGKKTKTVTELKTTLSNLKKGKVYYIRMKAYVQTPNGKKMWLPYGKVKKVKVKK